MPCARRQLGDVSAREWTWISSQPDKHKFSTYAVFFMSRMYWSPLMYVALPVRSDCPLYEHVVGYAQLLSISVVHLSLRRTGNDQELLPVV